MSIGQSIQICCPAMKNMIEEGAIGSFTTEAGSTGHMSVRGKNNQIRNYNLIRYCHFVLEKSRS
ncbi:MAG: hypothetical protein WA941_20770 [Nitrososphaeraceae archaeon]